jgi:hypothetical protein
MVDVTAQLIGDVIAYFTGTPHSQVFPQDPHYSKMVETLAEIREKAPESFKVIFESIPEYQQTIIATNKGFLEKFADAQQHYKRDYGEKAFTKKIHDQQDMLALEAYQKNNPALLSMPLIPETHPEVIPNANVEALSITKNNGSVAQERAVNGAEHTRKGSVAVLERPVEGIMPTESLPTLPTPSLDFSAVTPPLKETAQLGTDGQRIHGMDTLLMSIPDEIPHSPVKVNGHSDMSQTSNAHSNNAAKYAVEPSPWDTPEGLASEPTILQHTTKVISEPVPPKFLPPAQDIEHAVEEIASAPVPENVNKVQKDTAQLTWLEKVVKHQKLIGVGEVIGGAGIAVAADMKRHAVNQELDAKILKGVPITFKDRAGQLLVTAAEIAGVATLMDGVDRTSGRTFSNLVRTGVSSVMKARGG